jgi:hypothetical protein
MTLLTEILVDDTSQIVTGQEYVVDINERQAHRNLSLQVVVAKVKEL